MLENITVEDAVIRLSEADKGIHGLIIYPDLTTIREFYSCYTQIQLEEKNEMVLINPFYETTPSVRHILSQCHKPIDLDKHESEQTLLINDSLPEYFGIEAPMVSKDRLLHEVIKKAKNGLSVLADMGPFYYNKQYDKLVDYELSLPQHFDLNLKGICMYHQNDFGRLTEKQRQDLIEHHSMGYNIR